MVTVEVTVLFAALVSLFAFEVRVKIILVAGVDSRAFCTRSVLTFRRGMWSSSLSRPLDSFFAATTYRQDEGKSWKISSNSCSHSLCLSLSLFFSNTILCNTLPSVNKIIYLFVLPPTWRISGFIWMWCWWLLFWCSVWEWLLNFFSCIFYWLNLKKKH